jgi:hypothetical protein
MKVTIDRNLCDHVLPECERCFGRFLDDPEGFNRPCITDYVDDGQLMLTLTLRYDGLEEVLHLSPEEREAVARDGWSSYVTVPPSFYRA